MTVYALMISGVLAGALVGTVFAFIRVAVEVL